MVQIQADRRKQQRKWNRESNNQSRPGIQQKQQQNDGYQNHPLGQVVHHRVQGEVQQVAAIQHGDHLHPLRQDTVVQLVDFLVNCVERGLFLGALPHQHAALDDIGLVDNAPVQQVVGPSHVAQTDLWPLNHVGNVLDADGGAGLSLNYRLLDILDTLEESKLADIHLLHAQVDEAAAGVGVVDGQLLFHLADAQPIRHQLVRVHPHLVLAHGSPEVGDVDHVGNRFELLEQQPVLERPLFHQVVAGIRASDGVPIDLARGAPVGAYLRLQVGSVGKTDLAQSLQRLLTVPVVDGTVIEDEGHVGETEDGLGPQERHMRHSGHLNFDRNRHQLLYFFSGTTRPLGNDGYIVIRNVGVGFHRQLMKREGSPAKQQDGHSQHHKLVVEGKVD